MFFIFVFRRERNKRFRLLIAKTVIVLSSPSRIKKKLCVGVFYLTVLGKIFSLDGAVEIVYAPTAKDKRVLELPPELIYIGHFSFCACDALTSIIIPKSVMTICRQAFQQCWKLQILCEIESQPEGWDIYWNISECSVVWNYKK